MKRNTLFLLPALFLVLSSCNAGPQRQPLGKPVITVNAQKTGLTWEAVEDAVSYKVTVNNGNPQTVTTPGYTFSSEEGTYNVSVVAVADDEKYNSEASSYAYTTGATSVGELTVNRPVITWASYVGMGLEVKFGDNGVYTDVTGDFYTATQSGTYFFHAKGGFNETSKTFYVDGANSTRSAEVDFRDPLAAPVITVKADGTGIQWEAIENATGYAVSVDSGTPEIVTTTSYDFVKTVGNHTISVVAKADLPKYDSQAASFAYETKATELGALTVTDTAISWASSVGMGVEYSINGSEFVAVGGTSLTITKAGAYSLRAAEGFDSTNKVLYAHVDGTIDTRGTVVVKTVTQALVIEDGSEATSQEAKDKYYVERYDSTKGWQENKDADLILDNSNKGYTEGNAIRVKYFKHSAAFRFNTKLEAAGSYDTINATVKGDNAPENASFTIHLRVMNKTTIGSVNLQGVYMYYKVSTLPQRWTNYSVSFDDTNWKIGFGGSEVNFATVKGALAQAGVTVNKLADLIPVFDTVCFTFNCAADTNYSTTFAYIDDFKLLNTEAATSSKTFAVALKDNYAFESDALTGRLNKSGSDWALSFKYEGNPVTLPVTVATENDKVTVTSVVPTKDFVAVMESTDDGATLKLKSVTGTAAPLLGNLQAAAYTVIDDFESYSATGVGLDKNHQDPTAFTGLRAAYYSDYYGGGGTSPMHGPGWDLMGSADYLDLNTTAANVHSGAKSARLKYNASNQMQFSTWGLYQGVSFPWEKATAFSFWTKAVSTRDNVLKIFVYYVDMVTPSTRGTNCEILEKTVEKGSDWVEVVVPLKTARRYYGFTVLPLKEHGSASGEGQYFYIDDITIYSSISPWKEKGPAPTKTVINDFESYSATGVGYDTSNKDVTKLSGLRADFFCDYYKGGTAEENRSPVGGAGWFLMGSSDYMDYAYNSTTGNKSARLKQAAWSLNMRYINMAPVATGMGLAADTPALGTNFTKMSISVKGGTKRNITIKIYAYYQKTITASNQGSNRSGGTAITIPMNSDWTEYTIDLDSTKTYYGYAIIVNGVANDNPADYIYVDNISMY